LQWLMHYLPKFGFDDRARGMFVDQKLLPLVAQMYRSRFRCVDHPGYNVAYWNLHERTITKSCGQYFINDRPAVFFHMSGFRAEQPDVFSCYRSSASDPLPILKDIAGQYLVDIPADPLSNEPYVFDYAGSQHLSTDLRRYYFSNGTFKGFYSAQMRGAYHGMVSNARKLCRLVFDSRQR
jgi:hypothetical protein